MEQTWLSLLLGPVYQRLDHWVQYLGWPVTKPHVMGGEVVGQTWLSHGPIGAQHVLGALIVLILLTLCGFVAWRAVRDVRAALVPDGKLSIRTILEILVGTTYRMMTDMMGEAEAKHFLPLIGTLALFILFSNLMGIIPGLAPPTDTLDTTLACSVIVFFATQIYGVKTHGVFGWIKHMFGPIRSWVAAPIMIMMFGIESFSHLAVRPGSLAIRLMANMTADHMALHTFHSLAPWFVPVPIYMLGLLVIVVQTLIFCLLSTAYIAMAITHEEEH